MKKEKINGNFFMCILLSAISGAFAGLLVFIFKLIASYVIKASSFTYEFARENIICIPLFFSGIVLISIAIHFILKFQPDCRGGGIPTAIAYIRGNLSFNWIKTVFVLPLSALLTFFSGIPLGNEGPSVQLGCAAGRGVASLLKNQSSESEKNIMTAAASAGFAVATGAPFSAVIFAFEEIYRRFSVKLLTASIFAIMCAYSVNNLLGALFQSGTRLFSFSINYVMPFKYIWISALVGVAIGFAVVLTVFSDKGAERILKRMNNISMIPKILTISLITAFFGLHSGAFTGSGHHLIEEIFKNGNIGIFMLLAILIVRTFLLITAGSIGITGGKFLPTLALGAISGELSARFFIYIGFMSDEYRTLLVLMGVAAFLAAKSKIPVVALCFSIEALCGFSNIVHFIVCIGSSYLFVRIFKVKDFSESVIKKSEVATEKLHSAEVKL